MQQADSDIEEDEEEEDWKEKVDKLEDDEESKIIDEAKT